MSDVVAVRRVVEVVTTAVPMAPEVTRLRSTVGTAQRSPEVRAPWPFSLVGAEAEA